jgi:hypothetical protein
MAGRPVWELVKADESFDFGLEQLANLVYLCMATCLLFGINQFAVNRCLTHKTTCT